MTDKIAILSHLSDQGNVLYTTLMDAFYNEFKYKPLVIDKWFALQARATSATTLPFVTELLKHKDFSYNNPNRARSLIGVFLHANPARFHTVEGYAFACTEILKLDKINPKTAARLATAFENTSKLADHLTQAAKQALGNILENKQNISNDLYEIVSKVHQ